MTNNRRDYASKSGLMRTVCGLAAAGLAGVVCLGQWGCSSGSLGEIFSSGDGASAPTMSGASADQDEEDMLPSADSIAASSEVATVLVAENAYYEVSVPEGMLEDGYNVEYDDVMMDYGTSGRAGHITYVYTPSSGDDPYITVIQCTVDWFGLQGDEGQSTSAVAFTSEDADGSELQTIVRGGPWGAYGTMTREESLAFTQQWAQCVRPAGAIASDK